MNQCVISAGRTETPKKRPAIVRALTVIPKGLLYAVSFKWAKK